MVIWNAEDKQRIKEGIRKKYAQVASTPEGSFRYPTGRAGLEGLHYDRRAISALPSEVTAFYCGVGNPFALGPIHQGEAVLDAGCGGGVDTLLAAMMVGPEGIAVGIDLTPEMVGRAKENLAQTALENVSFRQSSLDDMPFADASFDVVISNGAFNLVPEKARALEEIHRVLKPGGRLMMADQILTGDLPEDKRARIAKWAA